MATPASRPPAPEQPEPMVALPRSAFERLLDLSGLAEPELAEAPCALQLLGQEDVPARRTSAHALDGLLLAKGLYQLRRRRDFHFGQSLFFDPAWDILLELYAAELTGRRVSVSSAGLASSVPATTALRWIKQLEDSAFIRREADADDRRRVYLRLSEEGLRKMGMLLHEARGLLSRCS